MLPILTPSLSSDNWRSLELKLIAITNKEKRELAPRDRVTNNVLSLAQSYARKQEWGNLFRLLIERGIIIEAEFKPEPKPVRKLSIDTIRGKLRSLLSVVLYNDRAIGLVTIQSRLANLGFFITDKVLREYLSQFSRQHIIRKSLASVARFTVYALQSTSVIDKAEWLPASMSFKIAKSNGCKCSFPFFRTRPEASDPDEKIAEFYAQYGIEYKFNHKEMDIYRWRVLN